MPSVSIPALSLLVAPLLALAPQPQPPPPVEAQPIPELQRQLVLDRRRRRLEVVENGVVLKRYPVAVGMPGWETPVGRFQVIEMATNPVWKHPANGNVVPAGPANPLGSRWIGFHRDCRTRRGFNGQEELVVTGCATVASMAPPTGPAWGRPPPTVACACMTKMFRSSTTS
jgi:hypothetical protein